MSRAGISQILGTSITVLVPTYKRSGDLARCLRALTGQTRPAEEVIVVHRDDDFETRHLLASNAYPQLALRSVSLRGPGQVAALNAGLNEVRSQIVAITDDDAAPRHDWLSQIEAHFVSDPAVGGVGGKDYIGGECRSEDERRRVGILQWFGRRIGNHHRGKGPPRSVDFLKGANMSYRMAAVGPLRFDRRLWGSGAQAHNDLAFSLAVRWRGWKLIYDPRVAVDHYPAERLEHDQRSEKSSSATEASAHNETVAILESLPRRNHIMFWLWVLLIGTNELPGLVRCVIRRRNCHRFRAMLNGRVAAAVAVKNSRRR